MTLTLNTYIDFMFLINVLRIIEYYKVDIKITDFFFGLKLYLT